MCGHVPHLDRIPPWSSETPAALFLTPFPIIAEELESGRNSLRSVKVPFADSVSSKVGKLWETPFSFLLPKQ